MMCVYSWLASAYSYFGKENYGDLKCGYKYTFFFCVLSLQEVLNGNLEREAYIGHDAEHMRGVLTLKHPIKNGIIHNWDEMEKVRLVFA